MQMVFIVSLLLAYVDEDDIIPFDPEDEIPLAALIANDGMYDQYLNIFQVF